MLDCKETKFAQGAEARLAMSHDDVIQDFDLEQLTGPDEVASHFDIGVARLRFAARVVVPKNDCGGTGRDCYPENFPGMHKDCVQCTNGNDIVAFDLASRVQEQNAKAFAFRVEVGVFLHMPAPVISSFRWCVAQGQLFRRRAFAQGHDLEFVRLRGKAEGLNEFAEAW